MKPAPAKRILDQRRAEQKISVWSATVGKDGEPWLPLTKQDAIGFLSGVWHNPSKQTWRRAAEASRDQDAPGGGGVRLAVAVTDSVRAPRPRRRPAARLASFRTLRDCKGWEGTNQEKGSSLRASESSTQPASPERGGSQATGHPRLGWDLACPSAARPAARRGCPAQCCGEERRRVGVGGGRVPPAPVPLPQQEGGSARGASSFTQGPGKAGRNYRARVGREGGSAPEEATLTRRFLGGSVAAAAVGRVGAAPLPEADSAAQTARKRPTSRRAELS